MFSTVTTFRRRRFLADLLTFIRLPISVVFILLGFADVEKAVTIACAVLILSWTTDTFDGYFAKSAHPPNISWIGRHDLQIDMMVSLGILVFLVLQDHMNLWFAGGLLILWLIAFIFSWSAPSIGRFIQTPMYGWLVWLTFFETPLLGWLTIAFLAAVLIFTWPRYPNELTETIEWWKLRLMRRH